MLNGSGQSFGLPVRRVEAPDVLRGVPSGRTPPSRRAAGISSQGCQAADFQAGSSSASFAPGPRGRSQYSTRSSPDQPTIAVPSMTTGSPAVNVGGSLSR